MMKMDIRKIFFRFSGLSFCLVLLSLAHEVHSEETINVASLCDKFNGTVDLRDRQQAILHYEEYGPMECKILLSYRVWEYVVISLYEWDLKENDKLVFRDGYTEVSLSGKSQRDEEKSFIFRGQTTIHFSTNDTFSSIPNNKFTFSYTASKTGYPKCKKSDFVCNNKICLNNSNLICDGKNNCGDWSDEIDCDKKCSNNEFECANRKCIPKYKLCNDRNDCGDMSDEEKCNRYCNLNSEFKCNNSMCISSDEVCDKKNDCGDWSDEINCHRECDSRQFPCINRKCIDNWKVCNGFDDCGDNSDERKCRSCSSLEFKCSNRLCISNNLVCNNRNDCGDNSDERGCRSCSSLEFECSNRLCISKNLVCNNRNDCGDNSDERDCRSCSSLEFECSNRLCISKNLVCNNRNDCGDNSDERDCNVAGGNVLEEKNKSVNPWYIAITICAVLLAIVVITFVSTLIRNRVADKKKKARNQLPNYSSNSGVHHVHTQNLMGRIRQSFRSGRQTSSPSTRQPVEMQPTNVNPDSPDVHHVNPPNMLERVRQSFRSGRQTASPSTKPPVEIQPTTVIPEPQIQHVSSMYPQLNSSADSTDVHHVNSPNLLERVRQSFRSGRQTTPSPIQPSDHISSAPVTTGEQTYQVPSMYPQIQSGFDNPEFKIEE